MALTEPHAGSALADLSSSARKIEGAPADQYSIRGSKIFISGGDQDFTENIVHLTLARIEGDAAGSRGVSLFAVPRMRPEAEGLVFNDVHTTQAIHKIGWKGLPSVALSYGENDDCVGWLIGEPGKGLRYMFQMMNGARIFVGAQAAATASVAYHESLAYARERKQGRPVTQRDPNSKPISIIEHADVRRMLLRQKSITEGSICLVLKAARMSDLSENHPDPEVRAREAGLLDLLTPIVKTFPAEWGYESNVLALQIFGGYGYSSEYPVESWVRDQKLNTIHEGTTGIQGLDLLGRKVMAKAGRDAQAFVARVKETLAAARAAELPADWCDELTAAVDELVQVTGTLAMKGMSGEVDAMMGHSDDYLRAFAIVTIAWCWMDMAIAAKRRHDEAKDDAARAVEDGRLRCAQYWIKTEVPRVSTFLHLCTSAESSYVDMADAAF
jgi:butyryl-CoA dehydrogenase